MMKLLSINKKHKVRITYTGGRYNSSCHVQIFDLKDSDGVPSGYLMGFNNDGLEVYSGVNRYIPGLDLDAGNSLKIIGVDNFD